MKYLITVQYETEALTDKEAIRIAEENAARNGLQITAKTSVVSIKREGKIIHGSEDFKFNLKNK